MQLSLQRNAHRILDSMNMETAKKIQAIIGKQEEKGHPLHNAENPPVPPDTRVEHVQNDYPERARDRDVIMYIYVMDEQGVLLG